MSLDIIIIVRGADTNRGNATAANAIFCANTYLPLEEHTAVTNSWCAQALEAVLATAQRPIEPRENWRLRRPTALARLQALRLIEAMDIIDEDNLPVPFVVPTPNSGLQLEWSKENRELELRAEPDGSIIYLQIKGNDLVEHGQLSSAQENLLPNLVKWLKG